jgi:hypothetical protein
LLLRHRDDQQSVLSSLFFPCKIKAQNAWQKIFLAQRLCAFILRHPVQVKKASEGTLSETKESFNYFNYFTEVEEEFVRRRGKPLFISPMDWALIESWKTAGIPLHVVLRAINEAFDAYDARVRKYRKVNSIFYCEQTVETMFADYRLSQVGAPPIANPTGESGKTEGASPPPRPAGSAFPKEMILDFLDNSYKELSLAESFALEQKKTEMEETIKRSRNRLRVIVKEIENATPINDEALERDLDAVDRMILNSIQESLSESQRIHIREEAESHLKAYKRKMDKKIFEQTLQNFIWRRLRELHRIPRLSLFYI